MLQRLACALLLTCALHAGCTASNTELSPPSAQSVAFYDQRTAMIVLTNLGWIAIIAESTHSLEDAATQSQIDAALITALGQLATLPAEVRKQPVAMQLLEVSMPSVKRRWLLRPLPASAAKTIAFADQVCNELLNCPQGRLMVK
jgi:hypothetical protein